jgi:hypothetical protein
LQKTGLLKLKAFDAAPALLFDRLNISMTFKQSKDRASGAGHGCVDRSLFVE